LGGEFPGVQGRQQVEAARALFERLGFNVYETSYEGPKTAVVFLDGEEIRFDIFMKQDFHIAGIHYFCESKYRKNASDKSAVKSDFKTFVKKALKVLPYAVDKYGEKHFCFLFISSIPFDIWEGDVTDPAKLSDLLDISHGSQESNIHTLSHHIRIMIFPSWLIPEDVAP
jgi:hypothetical protein